MKSATLRWLSIVAIIATVGIIVTQIFWVRSAYELEKREFNFKVKSALSKVANQVMEYKQVQKPVYNPVETHSEDYYMVTTNVYVEQDILEHFLVAAFNEFGVGTNFQFALYDCLSDKVEYQNYVSISASNAESQPSILEFPKIKRDNYYFGVLFPHRISLITSQLTYWIFSSIVLFIILLLLGYLLFIIFKQKRLSEIQKDFVNNMTHEFKTPLSSIQLSAHVLKNPDIIQNPQRLLNYATIISKETAQLTSQVERVLQMAHATKGELTITREEFIWQDLIHSATESFHEIIQAKNGRFILNLPSQNILYKGDTLHLENVLSNLIDNGIKYNEREPEITITLTQNEKHIIVEIADNGIGISEQYQNMLFKNFYRVPTGNVHNVKGFGLGLGYVKTIMKAHNGDVKCNSIKDEGSRFSLTFPTQP